MLSQELAWRESANSERQGEYSSLCARTLSCSGLSSALPFNSSLSYVKVEVDYASVCATTYLYLCHMHHTITPRVASFNVRGVLGSGALLGGAERV